MSNLQRTRPAWGRGWAALACALVAACGGGGSDDPREGDAKFSIGGSVSGLLGQGLVLRLNGTHDLAVVADGPFVFGPTVYEADGYEVRVQTQPTAPAQFCDVSRGSGNASADVRDIAVNCTAVQALYPQHGGAWNAWVLNDGASALTASDRACTIEAGRAHWNNCLHAGELRRWDSQRVIACDGLQVSDALDAFDWVCTSGPDGHAVFTSLGLKRGRRLSDLIDFDARSWRPNRIVVRGTQDFDSPQDRWWSNPVVENNAGGPTDASAITIVTADTQAAYGAAGGLVVRPGRVLRAPAGTVAVEGRIVGLGFWLEGEIDARGAPSGVRLQGYTASVLRGVHVHGADDAGIALSQVDGFSASNGLHVQDVRADHNGGAGVQALGGHLMIGVRAYGNGGSGVRAEGHLVDVVAAHNGNYGIELAGVNDVLIDATAVGNANAGILLGSRNQGRGTLAVGLVAVDNGYAGVEVSATAAGSTVGDLASAANGDAGLRVLAGQVRLTGTVRLGGPGDCAGVIAGCVPAAGSDAVFTFTNAIGRAFVGKLETDDAVNASDTAGAAAFAAIVDWAHFEHDLRGWGPDGGLFPAVDQRGPCAAGGDCRIWDWSLRADDGLLRAVLAEPGGDDALDHAWVAADAAACGVIRGAVWADGASTCVSRVLRHAVQAAAGALGNGLCEAGDTCLHTPDLGAYQGHGALEVVAGPTVGAVPGVTLLRHATNGR